MINSKKLCATVISILMTLGLFITPASAVSIPKETISSTAQSTLVDGTKNVYKTDDGFIYCVFDSGECDVMDYEGSDSDITIPKEFDGHKVIGISKAIADYAEPDDDDSGDYIEPAFLNNKTIKKVTINAEIEYLDTSAFTGCTELEKVVLPDSVTYIAKACFRDCPKLKSINIPKKLDAIGDRFAWESEWLKKLEKKNGLVVIANTLLSGRRAAGEVTVPEGVKEINGYAFEGNNKMTKLITASSVKAMGEYVITGCSSLKTIVIKNGMKKAYNSVDETPSLRKIVLPPSLNNSGVTGLMHYKKKKVVYYYYKGTQADKILSQKWCKDIKRTLLPGKTKIFETTPQKKKIKVTWKSVSTASGYQVQISTDKRIKTTRTATVKGKKSTSRTLVNLKSGRKYYVIQRSYRIVGGKKYFENYTKTHIVTAM